MNCQYCSIVTILLIIFNNTSITCVSKSKHFSNGKVVIITGANSGIGYETTKALAKYGAKIYMACRNLTKAFKARDEILLKFPKAQLIVRKIDLNSFKSVRKFCKNFKSEENRLDILINNAGTAEAYKFITEDGFEVDFQSNHLGHFLLTNILIERMKKCGGRVIIVSSVLHTLILDIDYDNLNSEKIWDPIQAYSRTKLFNIYFMRELYRRFEENPGFENISVNVLHPGLVDTPIFNKGIWALPTNQIIFSMIQPHLKTPKAGAETSVYLSDSEEVGSASGFYWDKKKIIESSELGQNMEHAFKIWQMSKKFVKIKPEEYHI